MFLNHYPLYVCQEYQRIQVVSFLCPLNSKHLTRVKTGELQMALEGAQLHTSLLKFRRWKFNFKLGSKNEVFFSGQKEDF